MSGIVGILNLNGSPADLRLLQQLTNSLKPRGPDAQHVWSDGPIGLGHTLFITTEEAKNELQPFTLGDGTWIVADARIDARRELLEQFRIQGQSPAVGASDAELILRSYRAWGEDCVEHLLGDFAFGIWDSARKSLFCARDQMGVRPFYYAQVGSFVVFSSALDCIRQCPSVSDRLNDLAIADFLIFGHNQNPATTSFADIQRLPAAHCLTWSRDGVRTKRYWTMPVDEPIFYKRKDDYCDRFKELLQEAVGDRLRTSRVGVFMSGGLDSTSLAATADRVSRERYASFDLFAITDIDDIKPEEGHYAEMVAKHLGIPIYFDKWDDKPVNAQWEQTPFRTAEPCVSPWDVLSNRAYWREAGKRSRVFFWGEGPDNALLLEWRPYLSYLREKRRYGRILSAVSSTLFSQSSLPFWGRISRRLSQVRRGDAETADSFPGWLNAGFESRLDLRSRWQERRRAEVTSTHPWRPQGYASLHIPLWTMLFEGADSGEAGTHFELRHPFVDLRMLRYLLAVPALPWCRSKYLLRRAMRGTLPNPVLRRRKKGLSGQLVSNRWASFGTQPFLQTPGISHYVDPGKIPNIAVDDQWVFGGHLRVRSLNHWLRYSQTESQHSSLEGSSNECTPEPVADSKKTL